MNIRSGLLLVATSLVISTNVFAQSDEEYWAKINALRWADGPTTVATVGDATFTIPNEFRFLGTAETRKFSLLLQNPPSSEITHTIAPTDLRWQAYLTYDDIGYVKDDEEIDADAVLASVREGTAKSNKVRTERGWDPIVVIGWLYKPHYNQRTNRLVWAIEARAGTDQVINYNERILGRRGVTSAVLVTGPEKLDASVAEFDTILSGYHFPAKGNYSEFRSGDRVAEIGLAALILGGGAAAVAKSGAGKVLFKFIGIAAIAAFIAATAFVKRVFGKR